MLGIYFDLTFQHATSGFSEGVVFNQCDFKQPTRPTCSGLTLLCQIALSTEAPIHVLAPEESIISNISDNAYMSTSDKSE